MFLTANRLYWYPDSDFESGACDVVKAAYDTGLDIDRFMNTFDHVGIKLDDCPYVEK